MSDEEFRKHSEGVVNKAVHELMAHFDNVQIFVTRVDDGETMGYASGSGNYYARIGHVTQWLDRQSDRDSDE